MYKIETSKLLYFEELHAIILPLPLQTGGEHRGPHRLGGSNGNKRQNVQCRFKEGWPFTHTE